MNSDDKYKIFGSIPDWFGRGFKGNGKRDFNTGAGVAVSENY